MSRQQGGVPSATEDPDTGEVWLYVHIMEDGAPIIRRAVSEGTRELEPSELERVIDRSIFPAGSDYGLGGTFSPSIELWP